MMNMNESMSAISCITALMLMYTMNKTHVMNNLILIEFIVISILFVMFIMLKMMNMENYLVLYFMIVTIAESIVGLSILVALIRTHGNDFLKSTLTMKL